MAATMRRPGATGEEIKCANCGMAIDISHAADHVCHTAPSAPMHPMDRFNHAFSSMQARSNAPFPFDLRRMPSSAAKAEPAPAARPVWPGQVAPTDDHSAIDRSYSPALNPYAEPERSFSPGPLSPRGFSSRPDRALTPGPLAPPISRSGTNSPFRMPPRAATASPRQPLREPSPDRPLPQECAFPAFPPPRKASGSRTGTPEPSRNGSTKMQKTTQSRRDQSPSHTLGSPRGVHPVAQQGEEPHVLGLPPGLRPADNQMDRGMEPEISSDNIYTPPVPSSPDRPVSTSPDRSENPRLPFASSPREDSLDDAHGPVRSPEPLGGHSIESVPIRNLGHFRKPSMSAASRPLHEIGSIKTHRSALSRSDSPTKLGNDLASDLGGPWGPKIGDERRDSRLENAPPAPLARFAPLESTVNHEATHSPAESFSSENSSNHTSSSRSSPPMSAASQGPSRKLSDEQDTHSNSEFFRTPGFKAQAPAALRLGPTVYDTAVLPQAARSAPTTEVPPALPPSRESQSAGSLPRRAFDEVLPDATIESKLLGRKPERTELQKPHSSQGSALSSVYSTSKQEFRDSVSASSQYPESQCPESERQSTHPDLPHTTASRRPTKSFSRPNYSKRNSSVNLSSNRRPPNINTARSDQPEHLDMEPPKTAPLPQSDSQWGFPNVPALPHTAIDSANFRRDAFPSRNASMNPENQGQGHVPSPLMKQASNDFQPPPLRHAGTSPRPPCRGCDQTISGKAVTSADGRLAGRWHRSCFVCKTCKAPFASNDFYVFGDAPYCARHYHQLNQTLCTSCDRGIEGPYVEAGNERMSRKFHPHCFTCRECHLILRDVHYEDPGTGATLCERHAMDVFRRGLGVRGPNSNGGLSVPGGAMGRFPEKRTTRLMMN